MARRTKTTVSLPRWCSLALVLIASCTASGRDTPSSELMSDSLAAWVQTMPVNYTDVLEQGVIELVQYNASVCLEFAYDGDSQPTIVQLLEAVNVHITDFQTLNPEQDWQEDDVIEPGTMLKIQCINDSNASLAILEEGGEYELRSTCRDELNWCQRWGQYCGDQWVHNGRRVNSWCPVTCNRCSNGGGGNGGNHAIEIRDLARRARGDSICLNRELTTAAQQYAEQLANGDCYWRNCYSHTGRDGSSPGQRAARAGYGSEFVAENLNWGSGTLFTSQQAHDGWMRSSGHRQNLMNRQYTHMGVGRAVFSSRGQQQVFWVQMFGNNRGRGCM